MIKTNQNLFSNWLQSQLSAQSVYFGLKESATRREIIETLTRILRHNSTFTVLQIFATKVSSIIFQKHMCFYLTSSAGTKAILLFFDTLVRGLRYLSRMTQTGSASHT